MKTVFSRLLRQSGLYAISNIALKASGLLLALLYLNPAYLSVEEFGYFGLLIVTAQFAVVVVSMGLATGLLKYMTDQSHAADRPAIPFTAFVATAVVGVGTLLLFWAAARPVASLMLDGPERAFLIQLLGLYVVFKGLGSVPYALLRVLERVGWYVVAIIAELIVLLGSVYYLLVVRDLGLVGLIGGYALSAGVSMAVLDGVMLSTVRWQFDRKLVLRLIQFGAPLVIAGLAAWFLQAGDRYLLKWLADARTVGLYEWAARVSGVLNMLFVQSFNLAFLVIGLRTLGEAPDDSNVHRRTFRHFVVLTGWAALGLSLIFFDLTRVLPADPYYLRADNLVVFLALGYVAYGAYAVVINVVYARGRTLAVTLVVVGAAALNATLNILLIPIMGALGAAVTTLLSYLALAIGATYFARKEMPIQFPWSTFTAVFLLVGVLYVLAIPSLGWPFPWRFAVRLALLLAYPALLVATRMYTPAEIGRGVALIRAKLGAGASD